MRPIQLAARALALTILLTPYVADAAPNDEEPAVTLMREGIALGRDGNLGGARDKLREAFKLKQSFDVAANLGFVESQLEAWRDAATHLAFAKKVFPPSSPIEQLKPIEEFLDEAKKHVGAVQLDAPAGATVSIDGESVGTTPLDAALFVEPGRRTIVLRKQGFVDARETLDSVAGQTKAIRIEMKAAPKVVPPNEDEKPIWPAIVLGSVGAAGLGVGIAGFVISAGSYSDAEDLAAAHRSAGQRCDAGCTDTDEKLSDASTFMGMGVVATSIAGAAGVATIIYVALPTDDTNPKQEAGVTLGGCPGADLGLGLKGRF